MLLNNKPIDKIEESDLRALIENKVAEKPIFDAVWNAAGSPRSLNYDEEGNWSS